MSLKIVLSFLVIGMAVAKIPTGLRFCGRRNPNLGSCMQAVATDLIPKLIQGVPEWKIPVVEPLRVDEIQIANSSTFTAVVRNSDVFGLSKMLLSNVKADLAGNVLKTDVTIPSVRFNAEYEGTTKVIVPLFGKGPIEVVTGEVTGTLVLKLVHTQRKGKDYAYLGEAVLKLNISDYTAKFQSRENPGGPLDQGINEALSSERKGLIDMVTPTLEKEISAIILKIGNGFATQYTYDELFPDTE